jgi:CPA1 family monovalent cation:H+ antiporter
VNVQDLIASAWVLTALLAWVNACFLHLLTTIAVMVLAIVLSLGRVLFEIAGFDFATQAGHVIGYIDCCTTLLDGMLSFVLFAGALQVKSKSLHEHCAAVAILASFGIALSSMIVAVLILGFTRLIGVDLPFQLALLLGTLISPTIRSLSWRFRAGCVSTTRWN